MFIGDSPWGSKVLGGSCVESIRVSVAGRGPLPRPESGLLSNTWKWIVQGDIHTDKAKDFIGKWYSGREQQSKGNQENRSIMWLTISDFMVMGLVSGFSLANHLAWPVFSMTQGPSWWCVCLSAKMNFSEKDYGSLVEYRLTSPSSFRPLLNSPS